MERNNSPAREDVDTPKHGGLARINLCDILHSGALFSSNQDDAYPSQLDLREVTSTSQMLPSTSQSSPALNPTCGNPLAHESVPLLPPHITATMNFLKSNPYLPQSDLPEFRRQQAARQTGGPQSQSSVSGIGCASGSEYHSTHEHRSWSDSMTEPIPGEHQGEEVQNAEDEVEQQSPPCFTPSHTPSHVCRGTSYSNCEELKAPSSSEQIQGSSGTPKSGEEVFSSSTRPRAL
ncbi:hypothetical protein M011DRAFT_201125 [Sporormia fimetaria CBS 119925]|uniref:Uncharacterized protein n=1 Tax=Sporormia fimetaria CBS 119925 TaxID=1340428 RepID=A0A6A6V1S6_9PLEO|nr:hypothetical protein M011DRAFT_201125 [Sporormia fimetaria CBS 119925]